MLFSCGGQQDDHQPTAAAPVNAPDPTNFNPPTFTGNIPVGQADLGLRFPPEEKKKIRWGSDGFGSPSK